MVASHIQNTKTILRLLIIICVFSIYGCISTKKTRHSDCEKISEFIQLNMAFSPDTIHYQKPFEVLLTFTNISDSILFFCPKGYTGIDRTWKDTAFIFYDDLNYVWYTLCDIKDVDLDSVVCLAPKASYCLSYDVQADNVFFNITDDSVICLCNTGGYIGKTPLCGVIFSEPVRLLVVQ